MTSAFIGLVFGLAVVAISVLVALGLGDTVERDHGLKSAVDCPSVPLDPSDCLWRQTFTVSEIHLWSGKRSENIRATLTTANGDEWRTGFRDNGPVLDELRDGDTVTGTIWRGLLVRISAHGADQPTTDNPDTLPESQLAVLVACGPSSLLLVAACGWRVRRIRQPEWSRGMKYLRRLAAGLTGAGVLAAFLSIGPGLPLWAMPLIWLFPAALMIAFTIALVRRQNAEAAQPPRTADAATGVAGG
ncbi:MULTISPECIES: hypothetical protein [Streptomyces]|uniref:Integral membrane protein n=2 Tax=Streptomyces TaxID=1883 RepID=A0ABV9J1J9_9ACTN